MEETTLIKIAPRVPQFVWRGCPGALGYYYLSELVTDLSRSAQLGVTNMVTLGNAYSAIFLLVGDEGKDSQCSIAGFHGIPTCNPLKSLGPLPSIITSFVWLSSVRPPGFRF